MNKKCGRGVDGIYLISQTLCNNLRHMGHWKLVYFSQIKKLRENHNF